MIPLNRHIENLYKQLPTKQEVTNAWGNLRKHIPRDFNELYRMGEHFVTSHTQTEALEDAVERAALGALEPIETYRIFDLTDMTYFNLPKLKKFHVVSDNELIKHVIHFHRNDITADIHSDTLKNSLGKDNMLLCPYASHRELRKPFELLFKEKNLKDNFFITQTQRAIDHLMHFSEAYDPDNIFEKYTFEAVTTDILGLKMDDDMKDSIRSILVANPQEALETLEAVINSGNYEPGKMVDILVKLKNDQKFKDSEFLSTLLLNYAAGVHTTTHFMKFFTTVLLGSGHIKDKLVKEWELHLEKLNIEKSDYSNYPIAFKLFVHGGVENGQTFKGSALLQACQIEALRLYPSIHSMQRIANKGFNLGGTWISKGDLISLDLLSANRNSRVWEAPREFKPERFIDEKTGELKTDHPAMLNFSVGDQSCIGKYLAKQESIIFAGLAAIMLDPIFPKEVYNEVTPHKLTGGMKRRDLTLKQENTINLLFFKFIGSDWNLPKNIESDTYLKCCEFEAKVLKYRFRNYPKEKRKEIVELCKEILVNIEPALREKLSQRIYRDPQTIYLTAEYEIVSLLEEKSRRM